MPIMSNTFVYALLAGNILHVHAALALALAGRLGLERLLILERHLRQPAGWSLFDFSSLCIFKYPLSLGLVECLGQVGS